MYFTINTSEGTFLRNGEVGIYDFNDHQYRRDDVAKILSYSHGPLHNITLRVNYLNLVDHTSGQANNNIEIMLTFGGRLSPMKRSDYTLTFQDLADFSRINPKPIETMFTIGRQVNQAMVTGLSEDERINLFLNH
jgi:hypothetical protein